MNEEVAKTINKEVKDSSIKSKGSSTEKSRMEVYMKITAISTSIIVLAIASLLLYSIRGVVIAFALAFLAAYILGPAVRFFERRRVNRVLVVSILYVLFVATVVISVVVLLPMIWGELMELQAGIQSSLSNPEFGKNISTKLDAIQDRLKGAFPVLENVDIRAQLDVDKAISGAASWILDSIGQLMTAITTFSGRIIWLIVLMILIPFISFFLLKDGETIKQATMKMIPSKYSEISLEVLQKIDRQRGRYIRGRIAESIILSVITIIGLRILGIKYYLVIGGIAGFANLIPYIGPVGISIPAAILAGYQYGMFHMILTIIFLVVLQIIDNAILVPLVVGKSVDLHPIVTIFVVFVGAQLLGLLGMIAAVPLTSIFIAIFQALQKEFNGHSTPA